MSELDSLVEITQKMLNIREGFEADLLENEEAAMREILRIWYLGRRCKA